MTPPTAWPRAAPRRYGLFDASCVSCDAHAAVDAADDGRRVDADPPRPASQASSSSVSKEAESLSTCSLTKGTAVSKTCIGVLLGERASQLLHHAANLTVIVEVCCPRVPGAKPSLSQALSQPQRPVRPSALSSGSSGWSTRPPPTPRPGAAPAASPAPSPSPSSPQSRSQ